MNELALFAGVGGGILGGKLLGWRTVCAVETNDYCRRVLMQRQDDGHLPAFPIWDDVRTFDGRPWRGVVDVVSGGFPCQDISAAGSGSGIDGPRSGLWREMSRIIREVGPRCVFVENSPVITRRGFGTVLGDLAQMGFDARWGVLGAVHVGAPHRRLRMWIAAFRQECKGIHDCSLADTYGWGFSRERKPEYSIQQGAPWNLTDRRSVGRQGYGEETRWWEIEPGVGRVADGVANRVDRLKATGNGQVPAVARMAWETLKRRVGK